MKKQYFFSQNLTSDFHVCRAAQRGGGHFHAGHLSTHLGGGSCRIVVSSSSETGQQVLHLPKYQVLVNVDGAARLEWEPWHQFTPLPRGAVYADEDIVVAR